MLYSSSSSSGQEEKVGYFSSEMKRPTPSIDLILFWVMIGSLGVAHSLLLTSGTPWESTTWFYIMMWVCSMVGIILCWVFYKEEAQFDYNEPLNRDKMFYVLGGVATTLFVSSILVRIYTRSSIWVPQPNMTLAIGDFNVSAVVNDLFFQLALVANSEETCNLAMMQVIRRKLTVSLPTKYASGKSNLVEGLSIALPRAGWAVLHAYVSYIGPLMPLLVASAFISGLIISWCAYNNKVRSFLVAVLIHFGFNAIVVVASALGLM